MINANLEKKHLQATSALKCYKPSFVNIFKKCLILLLMNFTYSNIRAQFWNYSYSDGITPSAFLDVVVDDPFSSQTHIASVGFKYTNPPNVTENPIFLKTDLHGGFNGGEIGREYALTDIANNPVRARFSSISRVTNPTSNLPNIEYAVTGVINTNQRVLLMLLDGGGDPFFENYFQFPPGILPITAKVIASKVNPGEYLIYGTANNSSNLFLNNAAVGYYILTNESGVVLAEKIVHIREAHEIQFNDAIELTNTFKNYVIVGKFTGYSGLVDGLIYTIDNNGTYISNKQFNTFHDEVCLSVTSNSSSNPTELVIMYEDISSIIREPHTISYNLITQTVSNPKSYINPFNSFTSFKKIVPRYNSNISNLEYYLTGEITPRFNNNSTDIITFRLDPNRDLVNFPFISNCHINGTSYNDYLFSTCVVDNFSSNLTDNVSGLIHTGYYFANPIPEANLTKTYFNGTINASCGESQHTANQSLHAVDAIVERLDQSISGITTIQFVVNQLEQDLINFNCYIDIYDPINNQRNASNQLNQGKQLEKSDFIYSILENQIYFSGIQQEVCLIDQLGRINCFQNTSSINLSGYGKGLYLLKMGNTVHKFVYNQ